jgi:DNA-binding XRE family transcriptional regulator
MPANFFLEGRRCFVILYVERAGRFLATLGMTGVFKMTEGCEIAAQKLFHLHTIKIWQQRYSKSKPLTMTNLSVLFFLENDNFVSEMKSQRCNTELLKKVAQRIKQLRDKENVSQDNFYIDTDIHIARIETGKTNITISTLDDICRYFSITLAEFFSTLEEQPLHPPRKFK